MIQKLISIIIYNSIVILPTLCFGNQIKLINDEYSKPKYTQSNFSSNSALDHISIDSGQASEKKNYDIAIFYGKGSRESIQKIIDKRTLIKPHSYYTGAGLRTPEVLFSLIRLNVEAFKHWGRQQSLEITLYPSIESKPCYVGNVGFNWGIGDGVSIMTGPYPKFEVYNSTKSRRVLNFLLIEQNMFLKNSPEYKLTLRWHHRCHCFNTIAPKESGSNFIALGFKYAL